MLLSTTLYPQQRGWYLIFAWRTTLFIRISWTLSWRHRRWWSYDPLLPRDSSQFMISRSLKLLSLWPSENKWSNWSLYSLICPISFQSIFVSVQFSSVSQSCPTLCDPMNRSTPGFPVHHHLPEFTQTHVHQVRDAIQPSHPQSSLSPTAPNPCQHQSLFQWVNSSHEVAKLLEFQL